MPTFDSVIKTGKMRTEDTHITYIFDACPKSEVDLGWDSLQIFFIKMPYFILMMNKNNQNIFGPVYITLQHYNCTEMCCAHHVYAECVPFMCKSVYFYRQFVILPSQIASLINSLFIPLISSNCIVLHLG